ncbi:MAG: ComEC/Rec2 family competence protein [Alphaproteobacteria bacterium]
MTEATITILQTIESFLDHQKSRLFLWMPVAVALGIGVYFNLQQEPPQVLQWVFPAFSLVLAGVIYFVSFRSVQGVLILMVCALIGFSVAQFRTHSLQTPLLHRSMGMKTIQGTLENVQDTPNGRRLLVRIDHINEKQTDHPFLVRLLCKTNKDMSLQMGDAIVLKAKIAAVSGAPYPGAYDFRRRAFFDGVSGMGFVTKIIAVTPKTVSARDSFKRFRAALTAYLQTHLTGQNGAIGAALLTGDTGGLSKETRQQFADSGLAHVLAISGLHLSLIGALSFLFFRVLFGLIPGLLLRVPLFKLSAIGALTSSFLYLNLSGASIPTQRSFISFSLMMVAVLLDRNPLSLRLVAIAALAILLMQPESLLTPSFQMSFSAVVALIGFYEWGGVPLQRSLSDSWPKKILLYGGGIIFSSIIASCATLPFTIYHFHKFSLQAILSNLLVLPLLTFWVMPVGIICVIAFACGYSLDGGIKILGQGLGLMQKVAEHVSSLPGASVFVSSIPLWGLVCFAFGGLWLLIWKGPIRFVGLVGFCLFGLSFCQDEKPFLFVSGDAKSIGIENGGKLYISSPRIRSFLPEAWAARLGVDPDKTLKFKGKKKDKVLAPVEFFEGGCFFQRGPTKIAYLKNLDSLEKACEQADILIAAEPLRKARTFCTRPKIIIDRFDVFFQGAHMITERAGGFYVETVRHSQKDRPWSTIPKNERLLRKPAGSWTSRVRQVQIEALDPGFIRSP